MYLSKKYSKRLSLLQIFNCINYQSISLTEDKTKKKKYITDTDTNQLMRWAKTPPKKLIENNNCCLRNNKYIFFIYTDCFEFLKQLNNLR